MNLSPKISVIVPVYRSENTLSKCIESILSQTITNFELLLIDDGSTDNSGNICEAYASKDSRIIVFHQQNSGVSAARNKGIDEAIGEYLCFVDSDDWIDKTYLADFDFENIKADLYVQGYKRYSEKKQKIISEHRLNSADSQLNLPQFYIEIEQKHIINSPCFKLFSREIIFNNSIRFDKSISFGEDHLFSLVYFYYISSAISSTKTGYVYNISETESLTTKFISYKEMQYYSLNSYLLRTKIIKKYSIQDVPFLKLIHQEFERFYILSIHSIFDKRSTLIANEKLDLFEKSLKYINSNKSLFSYKINSLYFELNRLILISVSPFKYFICSVLSRFYFSVKKIKKF